MASLSRPKKHRIFPYRAGTRRADLIELLEEPTSVEEVARRFSLTQREARQEILRIHKLNGYGIVEDESGRVSLIG